MTTTPTNDPAPAPEKPRAAPSGLTSAAPSPASLRALQADLAVGRISMADFLARLAEMRAVLVEG